MKLITPEQAAELPAPLFVCSRLVEVADEGFKSQYPELGGLILIMEQARKALADAGYTIEQ